MGRSPRTGRWALASSRQAMIASHRSGGSPILVLLASSPCPAQWRADVEARPRAGVASWRHLSTSAARRAASSSVRQRMQRVRRLAPLFIHRRSHLPRLQRTPPIVDGIGPAPPRYGVLGYLAAVRLTALIAAMRAADASQSRARVLPNGRRKLEFRWCRRVPASKLPMGVHRAAGV